ncbi:MAG: TIGR03960 family B12-binding radical SAM protein [Chloroflexi bacterium]|nr:TIGR03960 family B12-binding radical SAM protein [Chloroflexota bacterium]
MSEERLHSLLKQVQKPARYVGQELNSINKDWNSVQVTLALAYPDLYEIGMSNLGLSILYDLVNRRPEFAAERVYAPWADMDAAMRDADVPLFSLETRHSLDAFDVIGFSLQYELNYTNVLSMLDLGRIPVLARERANALPLVVAGGSCTYNPEPMADFVDAFVIGEGEQVLLELLECVQAWKAEKGEQAHAGRAELLRRLARIPGVYVPSLYRVEYNGDQTIAAIEPMEEGVPRRIRKRILPELGPVPTRPIVANMEVVHDRAMVEIQRGCSRGCRFCQAGIIYRPIRERPADEVVAGIDDILKATGYAEASLLSLSSSDHSHIEEIISQAMAAHAEEGLSISLPSLRIDSFSVRLAEMIQETRKTGFTFAPEAGSQRLRDVINKGVTEDDLLHATQSAFESGWNRLKLYFMLGLPTEVDDDVREMARLVRDIQARGKAIRRRMVDVSVSASTFVPKPHTPFQWVPLVDRATVEQRQKLLRDGTNTRGLRVSWSDWDTTWLEALLSRGDRRLGGVIWRAWQAGARFDAWSEQFRPDLWRQALAEEGVDPDFYTGRHRQRDETLPWDHIDVGVSRAYLWREWERALKGELSPNCREQCHGCGIQQSFSGEQTPAWRCPS